MADYQRTLEDEISGLKGQVADLTRRERHCQMLRRMLDDLREEYLSLAQSAPDAIIASDAKGRIVFWNQASQNLFGYEPGEVMGQGLGFLMPERYHALHERGFARALEAGHALRPHLPSECAAIRKDGTEFPIEITHSSWSRAGDIYFAAFIRDISERKHYEKLREDVERIIRHDLKSPLLGIVGFAKLLMEDHGLPEKQREWARLIHDSGMQMNHLLANSQAMLRIHQGSYRVTPRPVNLVRLLADLGKRFEPAMREKGVSFACEIDPVADPDKDCGVMGEEAFLDDMLSNLIKNAVEASPENEPVVVNVVHEAGHVVIDIHNRGVIPEHIREKFFEPYVTSGKKGGTGLGAHSALLIAKAHAGDITFTSDEPEGTHIVVRLPEGSGQE
ncbi:two-component system sensor histidine kinase NtrB [Fundidesulfovibrio terrae]|uniref:two-component system sensor histidine kinase NtrB n=1 Tax=Fundidesulfovibrio terrae TaxID=2922866 RepID=UPI001FAFAF7C|nr:PAS domain-containing sensor histidine kinase [Fundidesulfovibrio terrae]